MTREESIIEKRKAIFESCTFLAGEMVKLVMLRVPPRKKLFQAKNRSPLRRNKRIVQSIIQSHRVQMAQVRLLSIMSQPIPNYIKGGTTNSGQAIVGEKGAEFILNSEVVPKKFLMQSIDFLQKSREY